jgi:hypothetical protein
LKALGDLGEFQVVPDLLPWLADGSLRTDAASTIAALVSDISPMALAWIDGQARNPSCRYNHPRGEDWWTLSPGHVARLSRTIATYPGAIGVLASHPNGFVREAAVNALGMLTDGPLRMDYPWA